MNITVPTKSILSALRLAADFTDRKSSIQFFANVMLEASGDRVTVRATDGAAHYCGTRQANVGKPGVACVSARDLLLRVSALPGDSVTMTEKGSTLVVSSGKSLYKLQTTEPTDYPDTQSVDGEEVPVSCSALADMVDGVRFAVSPDESRQHINSVLLRLDGGTLLAVTTDGHRLAKAERAAEGKFSAVIPMRSVMRLRGMLSSGDIMLCTSGSRLAARLGDDRVVLPLSSVDFPPFEQVIPSNERQRLTIDRAAFLAAVQRAALVCGDLVGMMVEIGDGTIKLSAVSTTGGESEDVLSCETTGKPVSIGMSPKYLAEWLSAQSDASVSVQYEDELDPVVLTATNALGVIMPMRVA